MTMTPSPLEEVREAVCKAVPGIYEADFLPRSRDITLADVLRAIKEVQGEDAWEYAIDAEGRFMREWGEGRHETTNDSWNLSKPLDGQSESCILFLLGVLCGK